MAHPLPLSGPQILHCREAVLQSARSHQHERHQQRPATLWLWVRASMTVCSPQDSSDWHLCQSTGSGMLSIHTQQQEQSSLRWYLQPSHQPACRQTNGPCRWCSLQPGLSCTAAQMLPLQTIPDQILAGACAGSCIMVHFCRWSPAIPCGVHVTSDPPWREALLLSCSVPCHPCLFCFTEQLWLSPVTSM